MPSTTKIIPQILTPISDLILEFSRSVTFFGAIIIGIPAITIRIEKTRLTISHFTLFYFYAYIISQFSKKSRYYLNNIYKFRKKW